MSHSTSDLDPGIALDINPANDQTSGRNAKLRIAFLGTNGGFSHTVLRHFDSKLVTVCAIFCDASEPFHPHLGYDLHRLDPLPPLESGTSSLESVEIHLHTGPPDSTSNIIELGWKQDIPVYSVGRIRSQTMADTIDALNVDVACVACFNKRIPASLLKIPRLGFLNLHPSLLPDYRGPEPIQWILHDLAQPDPPARAQGGVTIHWMDENFDTGDIAYQEKIDFRPGTRYFEAERICANRGAVAYMHVLRDLMSGSVPRTPQREGGFYRGRLGYLP